MTINLNFFEDIQVGIDNIIDDGVINKVITADFDNKTEKNFQDPNFSVIYRNPKGSEFIDQDYDDKMYESREFGTTAFMMDTLSREGRAMAVVNNQDQNSSKLESPIPGTFIYQDSINSRIVNQVTLKNPKYARQIQGKTEKQLASNINI